MAMEWISMKDRLPENDEGVLVFVVGQYDSAIEIASYNPNKQKMWDIDWLNATVTHWMPLPEPPQKEKENENDADGYIDKNLKNLCGEHFLSGIELTTEEFHSYYTDGTQAQVLLFTLDGTTYAMREDPNDGYRSYCTGIETTERTPKFSFPPVKVLCSMMEDDGYGKNNCIVMRDTKNGEIILEAGTRNYDDYYPYCHFRYLPENMVCNQEARWQEEGDK